jgi:hypothetical protein
VGEYQRRQCVAEPGDESGIDVCDGTEFSVNTGGYFDWTDALRSLMVGASQQQ